MGKTDNHRRFCPRCRADYEAAGFRPQKIWTKCREPCDICSRSAWLFEIAGGEDDKR